MTLDWLPNQLNLNSLSKLLTVTFLFLSVQFASLSARGSSALCQEVFEQADVHELRLAVINEKHQALARNIEIQMAKDSVMVDGLHAAKLENNSGINNKAVFFFERDGSKRALKLFRQSLSEFNFQSILKKVALAGRFHGAKLYSFGRAKDENGKSYYFIEMDQVLSDQTTAQLKDLIEGKEQNLETQSYFRNPKFVRSFARVAIELAENKFSPNDLDLIIANNGEFRFIDADYWHLITDSGSFRANYLLLDLLIIDEVAGEAFRKEFSNLIDESQVLTQEQKQKLKTRVTGSKVKLFQMDL